MVLFQNLFAFYINSSIHVAFSVYAFTKITQYYFGLVADLNLEAFIFFGTITGYNFVKYAGVAKFYHRSLTKSLRLIQIFSLICFCLLCYFGWRLPMKTLTYFSPFAVLTLLYILPFLGGFQKSLRGVSYLKIFVVAIVWTGVTSSVPILSEGKSIDIILPFIQRMLFVLVLILPFEIRDMKLDIRDVRTLPQKIGVPQTKKVGLTLLLFVLILEFLISEDKMLRNVALFISFLLLFLIMRSKENQSKFYSSFWVESIPILWWLVLLIIRN